MKTAIALLALVAVAVANPVGPLVQLVVNINSADVPAGGVIDVVGAQPPVIDNIVDVMPVVDAPGPIVDVMPVVVPPGPIVDVTPVVVAPGPIVDVMPVVEVPVVITPVMPVVDPIPPSVDLAPPVLPTPVQPDVAVNLPAILN